MGNFWSIRRTLLEIIRYVFKSLIKKKCWLILNKTCQDSNLPTAVYIAYANRQVKCKQDI